MALCIPCALQLLSFQNVIVIVINGPPEKRMTKIASLKIMLITKPFSCCKAVYILMLKLSSSNTSFILTSCNLRKAELLWSLFNNICTSCIHKFTFIYVCIINITAIIYVCVAWKCINFKYSFPPYFIDGFKGDGTEKITCFKSKSSFTLILQMTSNCLYYKS